MICFFLIFSIYLSLRLQVFRIPPDQLQHHTPFWRWVNHVSRTAGWFLRYARPMRHSAPVRMVLFKCCRCDDQHCFFVALLPVSFLYEARWRKLKDLWGRGLRMMSCSFSFGFTFLKAKWLIFSPQIQFIQFAPKFIPKFVALSGSTELFSHIHWPLPSLKICMRVIFHYFSMFSFYHSLLR